MSKIIKSGEIEIQFDQEQAAAPIRWRMADPESTGGPDDWQPTPYQSADAGHREDEAISLVTEWLDRN